MKTFNNVQFSTSIRVLYEIKKMKGHKTLQETYKYLEQAEIDSILDVLLCSYNLAHPGAEVSEEAFGDILAQAGVGFIKISQLFREVVEDILFSGLSEKETADLKNQMANLKK